MKRSIALFFLLFAFVFFLKAQGHKTKLDPATAKKLYEQAQHEFALFEKQHGGFVQTKNVNMHYLSWKFNEWL